MTLTPQLYLASQSPRRAELLTQIGVQFQTIEQNAPEIHQAHETSETFVLRLAQDKAWDGLANLKRQGGVMAPVLASDTIVVLEQEIMGKPRDQEHALNMLSKLSGQTHQVMTAVAMVDFSNTVKTTLSISRVKFCSISQAQALAYWQTGEPRDKAGSYAIQGKGAIFVESLQGSYSGVMGLPLFETAQLLQAFSIDLLE